MRHALLPLALLALCACTPRGSDQPAADTDAEAQRHAGMTYFLFPLDAEGVTVRPIAQLDGEAGFAEIFFTDVFKSSRALPDAPVVVERSTVVLLRLAIETSWPVSLVASWEA